MVCLDPLRKHIDFHLKIRRSVEFNIETNGKIQACRIIRKKRVLQKITKDKTCCHTHKEPEWKITSGRSFGVEEAIRSCNKHGRMNWRSSPCYAGIKRNIMQVMLKNRVGIYPEKYIRKRRKNDNTTRKNWLSSMELNCN